MFAAKNELLTRPSGYNISRSLRFRSSASAYLSRTPASAGNRSTWTWSAWVKRGALSVTNGAILFGAYDNASSTDATYATIGFAQSDTLSVGAWSQNWRTTTQVFRDPSAWYHIVVAMDTTQTANADSRVRVFINGVEIAASAFGTKVNPTASQQLGINSVELHTLGRVNYLTGTGPYPFDGYMAEINFIDGYPTVGGTTYNATTWAALNVASLFGAFDTNGVWQPKAYTGTYGTNGFYLPFSLSASSTYAGSFNGSSQLLSVADNAAFTMGSGDFTIEAWVNFAASGRQIVVYQGDAAGANASISFYLERSSLNYLRIYVVSGVTGYLATGTTVIPNNQWVHIAGVRNGNNLLCYLNGVQQATASVTGVTINDSTYPVQISGYGNGSASGLLVNGSISNVRIVKGTAVYTSNFTPPSQALTAISGTSLLCLQSSSPTQENSGNSLTITNVGTVTTSTATPFVANVTADASGNNNGWIPANINASSSGTTYDSMIDSPTNYADGGNGRGNYAVWNSLSNAATYADANLSVTTTNNSAPYNAETTIKTPSSGKWYAEITLSAKGAGNPAIGVGNNNPDQFACYRVNGTYVTGSMGASSTGTPATFTTNDIIGVAFDADNGTLNFYKNGSLQTGGFTGITAGNYSFILREDSASGDGAILNCGQRPFTYSNYGTDRPAATFLALNTQNLPTPTIAAGNKYFDATTYTGDGAASGRNISLNFSPDLMWIKSRSLTTGYHFLFDGVRGATKVLGSSQTSAEYTNGDLGLGTNQFTIGDNGALDEYNPNKNTATYVAWGWNAGGTGVSNTSGSITSTVSANTSAGFSIVTYTGTGANATVGHGLGVAPSMIFVKWRGTASNWAVYHSGLTSAAYFLKLNLTDAQVSAATIWNSTAPTSTVFSIGNSGAVNNSSSDTYVAYCFAPVAGYSAAFSYTGNGSADGPMVYLGFRPRWVLLKRYDTGSTGSWYIFDTSRNTYNVTDLSLNPDLSGAESSSTSHLIDVLSNGFKPRGLGANINALNGTYIGFAVAENPFKYSRAR